MDELENLVERFWVIQINTQDASFLATPTTKSNPSMLFGIGFCTNLNCQFGVGRTTKPYIKANGPLGIDYQEFGFELATDCFLDSPVINQYRFQLLLHRLANSCSHMT